MRTTARGAGKMRARLRAARRRAEHADPVTRERRRGLRRSDRKCNGAGEATPGPAAPLSAMPAPLRALERSWSSVARVLAAMLGGGRRDHT